MCELFAVSADHSIDITGWLRTFFSHSDRHPHGCGLAVFPPQEKAESSAASCAEPTMEETAEKPAITQNGTRTPSCAKPAMDARPKVLREAVQASRSETLQALLAQGVTAQNAMAHIRRATVGNIETANCHPYVVRSMSGRYGTLAHNGTIFNYTPLNIYYQKQLGETDSERILLRLMDLLLQKERQLGRETTTEERFSLWEDEFEKMAPGNKLNVLFHYADTLYVHTNCEKTLYMRQGDGFRVFATVPLDSCPWTPVPMMRLLSFKNGHPMACGRCHGCAYVENKEDLKYLYMAYAGL